MKILLGIENRVLDGGGMIVTVAALPSWSYEGVWGHYLARPDAAMATMYGPEHTPLPVAPIWGY